MPSVSSDGSKHTEGDDGEVCWLNRGGEVLGKTAGPGAVNSQKIQESKAGSGLIIYSNFAGSI